MPLKKTDASRLKIEMSWQEAVGRLIRTPAKSAPPRAVKLRKKSDKKKR